MKKFKCKQKSKILINDKDSCLLFNEKNVFKINTSNPILLQKIGNKILKEDIVKNNENKNVELVKNIISECINQTYISEVRYKEYIINKENIKVPKNIKNCNLILVIYNLSINDLKKVSMQLNNSNNMVVVLNINGYWIITNIINKNTSCLKCVIDRWVESHREIYKYDLMHNYRYNIKLDITTKAFLKNVAINQYVRKNFSKVKVVDLESYNIQEFDIIKKEACRYCNQDYLETSNFILKNTKRKYGGNGCRILHPIEALRMVEKYIGPFSPIINVIDNGFADIISFPVFQSIMASNPLEKSFCVHGGKGNTYYQAKISAIGEAFERYNSRQHGNEKLIECSYNELLNINKNVEVLNPNSLCMDIDYPISYSNNKNIDWIEGVNLKNGNKTLIPANAVFFLYNPEEKEKQFMPQDTTGLASGATIEEAIYQGICEIIERDAYAIYYRQQLEAKNIDVDTIDDFEILNLIRELKQKNIILHIKHLTTDNQVYVIHCTTEDVTGKFPVYTHGAGASLNPKIAIERAITECIQLRVTQVLMRENKSFSDNDPYMKWGEGNKDWCKCFLNKENLKISFKELKNIEMEDVLENIKLIVKSISDANLNVYVVNLSRKDSPLKTVRVIIPGYQILDDSLRRNTKRMFEIPKKLGYKTSAKELFDKPFFS